MRNSHGWWVQGKHGRQRDLLSAGQETSGVGGPAIRKAASMGEIKGLGA